MYKVFAALADSGMVQALTSVVMVPKPRLYFRLSGERIGVQDPLVGRIDGSGHLSEFFRAARLGGE